MTRDDVYGEIESTFGLVPTMFKSLPDSTLELEWNLFKQVQLAEGPIPNKYKELIGLGIAAVSKCRYCIFYHTTIARLHGATDEEVEDAVHYAKSSAGWSAYLNGLDIDYDTFRSELQQAVEYVKSKQGAASETPVAAHV